MKLLKLIFSVVGLLFLSFTIGAHYGVNLFIVAIVLGILSFLSPRPKKGFAFVDFAPSLLVDAQAKFSEKFMSGEWRMPDVAAFQVAEKGEIANPGLAAIREREDRQVFAYFPIRQAATNGTARAFNHTGARGDSQAESITWVTFSEPFSISLKQGDNNVFDFDEQFAATARNAIYNINNRVDDYLITQLLADKTLVNVGGGNGAFDGVTNDYQLAAGFVDFYYENTKAMMQQNLFRNPLTGIVDSVAWVNFNRVVNQGGGNAENLQYQTLSGWENVVQSTREILAPATYGNGSGLFFENGLVAMIPWIPKQNRKPLDPEKAMSFVGDYGEIAIPEMGVSYAIHAYSERADNQAVNGQTQDVTMQFEISIDFAYASAPLSPFRGANDSVVYTSGVLS
jgi:hypothetical protein